MLSLINSVTKGTPCRAKMKTHKDVLWTTANSDYVYLFKRKLTGMRYMKKYLFKYTLLPLIFQDDQCTASNFNKEI